MLGTLALACTLLGNWKKTHDTTEFLHWSKLGVKKKTDIENQLRIALSMSAFTSEIPINLRITYSPVASKNVLLVIHCSRVSSILLANTRNKKVNLEAVKCSTNFSVLVAHYCCPRTSGFWGTTSAISWSLCNSTDTCFKFSPHERKKLRWKGWVEMEHSTQGTGVQFVVPQQIYCTISGKSLQPDA